MVLEASLILASWLLSIIPAALNSSRNCEVPQDVVASLSPLNHPLIQVFVVLQPFSLIHVAAIMKP